MDYNKLAETVLYQLEFFRFLQFVDEQYEKGDDVARRLMHAYFMSAHPDVPIEHVLPLVRLNTTLALLTIPFAYAARIDDSDLDRLGLNLEPRYAVSYMKNGRAQQAGIGEVLRVVRNAVAHLPDFAAGHCQPNVSFDRGVVAFTSEPGSREQCEVVFETEVGFVLFLRDFLTTLKRAVGEIIQLDRSPF